jgi:hypothetical protein
MPERLSNGGCLSLPAHEDFSAVVGSCMAEVLENKTPRNPDKQELKQKLDKEPILLRSGHHSGHRGENKDQKKEPVAGGG